MCPECREKIGLGAYYLQAWVRRIDCPACKKTVRVRGMLPLAVVLLVPATALGWLAGEAVRAGDGYGRLIAAFAALVLLTAMLIPVGLATWMRIERDGRP